MLASNSVSTIFRCLSCSFGTCDQNAYAEHIKHCSDVPVSNSEASSAVSDGEEARSSLSETVKSRCTSYECTECHLHTGSSRALLLHLRDVHEKDLQIFICRFCSHYAARNSNLVNRHARRLHPESAFRGRAYTELIKKSVIRKPSTDTEVNECCMPKVQTAQCEQQVVSSHDTVQSSRSLGLQFLGKQLPDVDSHEFTCQLCDFSHALSHSVVKHIWKDHKDKVSEITVEASITQSIDDNSVTNILYKCDDCSYSTRQKLSFYHHCSLHQFSGPSKCSHCSFSALTDTAINHHTQKYHTKQLENPNADESKCVRRKVSTTHTVTKQSGHRRSGIFGAQQRGKSKWFACPYCTFKSKWRTSVYKHKARLHPEYSKMCRKRSSTDSISPDHKLKMDTDESVEMNASNNRSEQRKPPLSDAASTPLKRNIYKCNICSMKLKTWRCLYAHKQVHVDLRRYQCPLCGLRSNYSPNMQKHISTVHKDDKAEVIKLSTEDAKQTIEEYKKQTRKQCFRSSFRGNCIQAMQKRTSAVHKGKKVEVINDLVEGRKQSEKQCFQCPLCGIRRKYIQNIQRHISVVHEGEQAQVITLSSEDAKRTTEEYRKLTQRQVLAQLDFRRYECPLCGYRGNYRQNVMKHIYNVHKNKRAKVIILSIEEAKQTIEAYRNQHGMLSDKEHTGKRLHSSSPARGTRLLHPSNCGKSRELRYSKSVTNNYILSISSEDNFLQMKKPRRKENASISQLSLSSNVPKPSKCYACSLCKMESDHLSSIYRHMRSAHHGRKARIIIAKHKRSEHRSKLLFHGKTKRRKPTVESSKSYKRRKCLQTDDSVQRDDGLGGEPDVKNTVKIQKHDMPGSCNSSLPVTDVNSDAPVQQLPAKQKEKLYACGVCPYRANDQKAVINHRRLHVKRPGYTFACSICPYYAPQGSHLERHMKLHGKQSTDVDIEANQSSDPKINVFCDLCPYMTSRRSTLLYHKQLHRPRATAQVKCEHCAYWVQEPYHMLKHFEVHTEEYMKKRMKYGQLPQTSNSLSSDVKEVAFEGHSAVVSDLSASTDTIGLDVITDKDKLDETTQNNSANDVDETKVSSISASASTEQNAATHPRSSATTGSHQVPTRCCERCPYSTSKLACFKRHVWLHGKPYRYKCCYCDYSVESYWQLVSHVLWHFAPNKHLVYAQPVSNLESFLSHLPSRDSIPDSLASIERLIPSFENSDVFVLSDAANLQCNMCPFVTEQRSEFLAHMLCHCDRTAAYSCPLCNFHTDNQEILSTHLRLHFNLPGCRQSSLPPNTCHSEDWQQLDAAIEVLADTEAFDTFSQRVQARNCNDQSCDHIEPALPFSTENPADCEDQSMDISASTLKTSNSEDDNTQTLATLPLNALYNAHNDDCIVAVTQHAGGTDNSVSADSEQPSSANSTVAASIVKITCCRYCDTVIDGPTDALAKHEAAHLIGF